jgi:tetratricopeptide (TPR) repeat protein
LNQTLSAQSPSSQDVERLRLASGLLMQRRPADAVGVLGPLKAERPGLVEARRLLGLAFREMGDLGAAELEFREALALEERPELFEALAATLEMGGLRALAEASYRQALAIDPLFGRAAVGLSELLLNENRVDEAAAVIAPVAARPDADIHALSAHALVLKALRRGDEAVAVYRRAIQIAPRSAVAEHNLGAALGDTDQFAEAEAAVRRAMAKGLDAPQTWAVLGRALQGQDRFDAADGAYRQALRRAPNDAETHASLAQLIWMRTEDAAAACAPLDAAIASHPGDVRLMAAKARVLDYAGAQDAAYGALAEALAIQADPGLHVQASHIIAWSDPDLALDHAQQAAALAPDRLDILNALCLANLAAGRAQPASDLAAILRQRAPFDQHAVALQATAWRMLGDGRYAEIYDYETMVRSWTIDTPTGWASLEAFLADLAEVLQTRHQLKAHPIGQSLRKGVQTQQNLFRSDDPVIRAFFKAIDAPIRRHIAELGSGTDPLRARIAGDYRIEGAWSVRLRPGGFHTDHLHGQGWLSSACYIALPRAIAQDKQGWIRFGRPGVPTRPDLPAETHVRPEPGLLVLFPSYMWHGTEPFAGDEPRLTIAFDVVPA